MKKTSRDLLLAVTAAALFTTYSAVAHAQGRGPGGGQGPGMRGPGGQGVGQRQGPQGGQNGQRGPEMPREGRGPGGPGHRIDRLSKDLNLTSDQQTKLKSILENQKTQLDSLRDDSSLTEEQRRAKFDEIRKVTQSDINNILTDEQKTKFADIQSKMKERRQRRPEGEGHGDSYGPPPQKDKN